MDPPYAQGLHAEWQHLRIDIDPYEPGTRRERTYMCGISSVHQEDNMKDATSVAAAAMMEDIIVVQIPGTEWDLDEDISRIEKKR
jgi:hypothetical protein